MTLGYCVVPYEIWHNVDLHKTIEYPLGDETITLYLFASPYPIYLTLITSMFLHASWMHLLLNMLFLYIFGDQIEDILGHLRYLVFFLLCGVFASFSEIAINPNSIVPMVGASGAISGALGAYFIKHPKNNIKMLIGIFAVDIPAFIVLGLWFALQAINDVYSTANLMEQEVAYSAHLGGFVAGVILILILPTRKGL